MEELLNILKIVLFGIIEGITEWLPISSTGHMILLEEFLGVQDIFGGNPYRNQLEKNRRKRKKIFGYNSCRKTGYEYLCP